MGETEFGAGVFYLYLCLDCGLLTENLGGDAALAKKAARALVEAAATVAPTGKQNSFASRSYAQYILAECGERQPRSLAAAFFQPVPDRGDQIKTAIDLLTNTRDGLDQAYGPLCEANCEMNVPDGKGTLAEILAFVEESSCLNS